MIFLFDQTFFFELFHLKERSFFKIKLWKQIFKILILSIKRNNQTKKEIMPSLMFQLNIWNKHYVDLKDRVESGATAAITGYTSQ